MPKAKKHPKPLRWLFLSAFVLVLDFVTKQVAVHFLTPYEPHAVFPGLNFMLAFNKGAAFSFLSNAGGWQQWALGGIAIVVVIVLLIWLRKLPQEEKLASCGIALIIGGALGNLCDRAVLHYVIDFIDVYYKQYHWPTFNIADSAICLGVLFIVISIFNSKRI